ncbi:MAG: hypothetical protein JXP73_18235 [Deltaproteobacteria bacterium]|nr:hypothetical protein [Deltaproteobacteria bacterium]
MPERVQNAKWVVYGALLVAAVLVAGCKPDPKSLPSLPAIAKSETPRRSGPRRDRRSRAPRWNDIAPMVVPDEPAPAVAEPAARSQGGGPATLNGDPNGLTRETLNRSIQGAMGSLAACFTSLTHDPMVAVSFEADPSGRPSLVRVRGAPPDVERCIRSVVGNIRFPGFQGKGVQVDLPLSFHRSGHAAPPPASLAGQGEAPPGAPPLFIEP